MRRRSFLASLGTAALAGCTGNEPTPTPGVRTEVVKKTRIVSPTPTPTPTETPTPTATPEPPAPRIINVQLVSEWETYGDVADKAIDEVAVGERAWIGFRQEVYIHDGTLHVFEDVEVREQPSGNRVGHRTFEDEQLTDGSGLQMWEHALPFYTDEWSPGEYRARVIIRDEVTGKVSEPAYETFDVVE